MGIEGNHECEYCGRTFENAMKRRKHQRTTSCIQLPDGWTESDLVDLAERSDVVLEIQRELRMPRDDTKALLSKYDLLEEFSTMGRNSPEQLAMFAASGGGFDDE